jgi:hypothetical protein
MELGVFGQQLVGLVVRGDRRCGGSPDHVAEAGVLEEMAPEGVARRQTRASLPQEIQEPPLIRLWRSSKVGVVKSS